MSGSLAGIAVLIASGLYVCDAHIDPLSAPIARYIPTCGQQNSNTEDVREPLRATENGLNALYVSQI